MTALSPNTAQEKKMTEAPKFKIGDLVAPASKSHPDHGKLFQVCDVRHNPAREAIASRPGWPGCPAVPAYITVSAFDTGTHAENDYPLHMSPDGWVAL